MDNPIYTVTTLRRTIVDSRSRCVGFEHTLDEAKEIVEKNIMDINELGYYHYAVIEEVYPGLYTVPRKEYWYEWIPKENCYIACEKPKPLMKCVAWSIG